jgi:hypothetical protein
MTVLKVTVEVEKDSLAAFQKAQKSFSAVAGEVELDISDLIFRDDVYPTASRYRPDKSLTVTLPWPYTDEEVRAAVEKVLYSDVRILQEYELLRAQFEDIGKRAKQPCETKEEARSLRKQLEGEVQALNALVKPLRDGRIRCLLNANRYLDTFYTPDVKLSPEAQARYAAEEEAQRAAAAAEKAAAAAKAEDEALAWAKQYGSEQLQLALAGHYPSKRLYTQERVAHALRAIDGVNIEIDWQDKGGTDDKASPSLRALELEQQVKQQLGPNAEVRIVYSPRFWIGPEDWDNDGDDDGTEMIRIVDFEGLGKDVYLL